MLHTLRLSCAKVILTDAERRPRVDEVAGGLNAATDVVVLDVSLTEALSSTPVHPVATARRRGGRGRAVLHLGHDRALKAVATTWHYLFSVAATVASAWEFGAGRCCGRRCRSSI